jgi:hypothetical protein
MRQTIWFQPEYNSKKKNIDIYPTNTTILTIEDINIKMNNTKSIFVIDVYSYYDVIRVKWLDILNHIKQIWNNHNKLQNKNNILKIIFLNCERFSKKEWMMFRADPFSINLEFHFITRSLVSIHETILARAHLNRLKSTNESTDWINSWWLNSAKKACSIIKKPFSKDWNEINKIIHEWILFNVDYESAIFYISQILNDAPIEVRCKLKERLLSNLSFLSKNHNRESTKPSIIATTRQHIFYILELCMFIIHEAYHQELKNKPKIMYE